MQPKPYPNASVQNGSGGIKVHLYVHVFKGKLRTIYLQLI